MKKLLYIKDSEEFWKVFNGERKKTRRQLSHLPYTKKIKILSRMQKLFNMSRKKGFTLVEILVATTIMVIAIAAIHTSFRGGMTSWTKGTARMQRFLNARAALDMMSREIRTALIAASNLYAIDFVYSIDTGGALRFAAPMDGHAGEWDMVEIAYKHVGGEIKRALDVNPTFPADKAQTSPLNFHFETLVSNIISLEFHLWDGLYWWSDWDSRTTAEIGVPGVTEDPATVGTLPQAVRITIEVQDEQEREKPQTFSTIVYLPTSR